MVVLNIPRWQFSHKEVQAYFTQIESYRPHSNISEFESVEIYDNIFVHIYINMMPSFKQAKTSIGDQKNNRKLFVSLNVGRPFFSPKGCFNTLLAHCGPSCSNIISLTKSQSRVVKFHVNIKSSVLIFLAEKM